MNIWKRFAAALLAAGMVLAMLAACSDGGGTPLSWETSQTKKYFESKGITDKEYTFKAKMAYSGTKSDVVYTVKDNQFYVSWPMSGPDEILRDAQGNYYTRDKNRTDSTWVKYAADSEWAKNYGSLVAAEVAAEIFVVPTDDNVGSVVSGSYRMGGKNYSTETIRIHGNNSYQTCIYGYDGNELSFILVETTGSAMLTELVLNKTADDALLTPPTIFVTGSTGGGSAGGSSSTAASSAASSSSTAASTAASSASES